MGKNRYHHLPALLAGLVFSLLLLTTDTSAQDGDPTKGIGEQENLGPGPNSEWPEILPRVTADGSRLYFVRKHAPMNTGGVDDQDDIYYSDLREDGTWGPAVNVGSPLNTPGSDVLFWISGDESTALVYHGREIDGAERGLSITRKVNGDWAEPKKISIEGVESLGNWYYASISPDRSKLLLAYSAQGDEFNLDIFYAPALSNDLTTWGRPVPINGVNTPFLEGSPWLSPDGRSLYFVSDRPGAAGLGDVYISRRVADDWEYWSQPEDVGPSVNTPAYEADVSITADGKWMYVGRIDLEEPPSHGRSDLYRYSLPDTLGSSNTIIVTGRLVDAATGRGVPGEAQVFIQKNNLDLGKVQTDASGNFSILVMPGLMLKIVGIAPGYQTGGVIFDGRRIRVTDPPRFVQVQLQKSGQRPESRLSDIRVLFATGSDRLGSSARTDLRRFAALWKKEGNNPAVTLYGFTDSVGTVEDNFGLAERRTAAVAAELERLGLPTDRIRQVPRGEARLAGSGADEGSGRLNRRVDVRVE